MNEIFGACSACVRRRGAYRALVWGRSEGKRPLGRPKRMWKSDINIDVLKVG
jgi:hypothetical protein